MTLLEVVESVAKAAAPVVIPLLVAGITALGTLVGRWIHANTGSSKLLTALATGSDYVGTAVSHILDGMKADVAAALANDGKIDALEAEALKEKALKLVLAEMPGPLQEVAKALGPAFQTWISGKVGQAVQTQLGAPPPQGP